MGNPLDFVTEDQSQDDPAFGPSGLRRVYVYSDPQTPEGDAMVPQRINAPLAAAVAPEPPSDLMKGLALLKDRLLGTGGQERFQTWPERMVRSAVDAPHAAMTSEEPVTSEQMVAPAQDIAGLASGSTLFSKPGAGTLGSGAMRPGAKTVPTEPAPVFYSALEHAATNAAQDTMSPQQWLGYLKNQPGVKKEELEWSGLEGWLNGQKGKVKKEDVQQYLDAHKTEIKDVTKKGPSQDMDLDERAMESQAEAERTVRRAHPELDEESDAFHELVHETAYAIAEEEQGPGGGSGTKYSSYQLPGGENYREHLLTLPQKDRDIPWSREKGDRLRELDRKNEQGTLTEKELEEHIKLNAEANARDRAPEPYQSSHWDEPNVLAHVRTNDRDFHPNAEQYKAGITDVIKDYKGWLGKNGLPEMSMDEVPRSKLKPEQRAELDGFHRRWEDASKPIKSLHIEEIQSDWHQQGRKQGYNNVKMTPEQNARYMEIQGKIKDTGLRSLSAEEKRELLGLQAIYDGESMARKGVPDAPFKSSWPELALKRMIRHAAENGYDRISWTPGEAQAARYDLSKTIDSVWWSPEGHMLQAYKDGKVVMNHEGVPPEKLADYVGKEAAEKLVNSPTNITDLGKAKRHELSGLDLKVGGEGMREFYDKMLPKMVEKIGKAHGVKVKRGKLSDEPEYVVKGADGGEFARFKTKAEGDEWIATMNKHGADYKKMRLEEVPSGHDIHYFDLPQSLKDHAVGRGFPLYMSGVPFPLTPVDHDPFKKKEK